MELQVSGGLGEGDEESFGGSGRGGGREGLKCVIVVAVAVIARVEVPHSGSRALLG